MKSIVAAMVVMALVSAVSGIALLAYLFVSDGPIVFSLLALRHPKE